MAQNPDLTKLYRNISRKLDKLETVINREKFLRLCLKFKVFPQWPGMGGGQPFFIDGVEAKQKVLTRPPLEVIVCDAKPKGCKAPHNFWGNCLRVITESNFLFPFFLTKTLGKKAIIWICIFDS